MAESAESSHHGCVGVDGGFKLSGRLAPHSADGVVWRKSSHSGYNGDCVEVAVLGADQVGVRDSKAQGAGPVLCLTSMQWTALLAEVRAGRFELG